MNKVYIKMSNFKLSIRVRGGTLKEMNSIVLPPFFQTSEKKEKKGNPGDVGKRVTEALKNSTYVKIKPKHRKS